MTLSARIFLAFFITAGVVGFFLRPTIGIGMVLGLSQTAAIIAAVVVAVVIGVWMAFGLFREPRETSSGTARHA